MPLTLSHFSFLDPGIAMRQMEKAINALESESGSGGGAGPAGPQGPPGPTAVSADAGNLATLGTDGLTFVPKQYVDDAVTSINVVPQAPVCAVTASQTQPVTRDVLTLVMYDTAEFDNTGAFDLVQSRFCPKVAGYYQVNGGCGLVAGSATMWATLFKNGAEYRRATTSSNSNSRLSTLIHLNGVDDYVEVWVQAAVNSSIATTSVVTSFSASLAQAAAS